MPTNPSHASGQRSRLLLVIAISAILFSSFAIIGWLVHPFPKVADLFFCYLTLTNCSVTLLDYIEFRWPRLLAINLVVFCTWLVLLVAAHSFVVGVSTWRRVLGGLVAVLGLILANGLVTFALILDGLRH